MRTWATLQADLAKVDSHAALVTLVEAVDAGFMADRPTVRLTDAEWALWTSQVAETAARLERHPSNTQ